MTEKRVALVTGSTSGIGAGIARRLAAGGMRVVLNSSRSTSDGEALAASLPDAIHVSADVSDEEQAAQLVGRSLDHYGHLDVLVNNAGITRPIPHRDVAAADGSVWREIFAVNVFGVWQVTAAALPALAESGTGSVVNVSSVAGSRAAGSSIPYAVSKAALEHMTRLLAASAGPSVRVNAVAPGLVETPRTAGSDFFAPIADQFRTRAPLARVGQPADVADAVALLLDAPYTTGQVLSVDGGAHLV